MDHQTLGLLGTEGEEERGKREQTYLCLFIILLFKQRQCMCLFLTLICKHTLLLPMVMAQGHVCIHSKTDRPSQQCVVDVVVFYWSWSLLRPVGFLQMAIKMHELCGNCGEELIHLGQTKPLRGAKKRYADTPRTEQRDSDERCITTAAGVHFRELRMCILLSILST